MSSVTTEKRAATAPWEASPTRWLPRLQRRPPHKHQAETIRGAPGCAPQPKARGRARVRGNPRAEMRSAADFLRSRHSSSNPHTGQLLPQLLHCTKYTRLYRSQRQIERICNFCVRKLFNQRERCNHLQLGSQLAKRKHNRFVNARIRGYRLRNLVSGLDPTGAWPHRPQMIACCVGGDYAHPSAKTPGRVKSSASAICSPKRLDNHVFGAARVPDNSQDPAINLDLELPEKQSERLFVPLHEPLEQVAVRLVWHKPLLCFTRRIVKRFQLIFVVKLKRPQGCLREWAVIAVASVRNPAGALCLLFRSRLRHCHSDFLWSPRLSA